MTIQFVQAIEQFISYIQLEKNFSPLTVRDYESDINEFYTFLQVEGISDLDQVEYLHARLFVTKLYEEKKARTTVSRKISSIRSFFKFLNKEYEVDDSAFQALYHPKKQLRLPHFFYEEELSKLFEANEGTDAKSLRNMAILELLYATGIRVSELTSIELKDIDFSLNILRVMGKGRKERYVPFGHFAAEAMQRYLAESRPNVNERYET